MSGAHRPSSCRSLMVGCEVGTAQLLREENIQRLRLRKIKAFVLSDMESFASPLF